MDNRLLCKHAVAVRELWGGKDGRPGESLVTVKPFAFNVFSSRINVLDGDSSGSGQLHGSSCPGHNLKAAEYDVVINFRCCHFFFILRLVNTHVKANTIPNTNPKIIKLIQFSIYNLLRNVDDPDIDETFIFELLENPEWLIIDDAGILSGIPENDDVGTDFSVSIAVSDAASLADTLNCYNNSYQCQQSSCPCDN